nr:hypothetical protein [Tanacetum cinerariifolium]
KVDEKKRDMSKVKCYNCKKEGHFSKDYKKAKIKDYNYYKTKMLLAKKDSDEQVLLAENQAWMESNSDYDQEINANMVFIAQIKKADREVDDVLKLLFVHQIQNQAYASQEHPISLCSFVVVDERINIIWKSLNQKRSSKTINLLNSFLLIRPHGFVFQRRLLS